jgi:hypothetical protein
MILIPVFWRDQLAATDAAAPNRVALLGYRPATDANPLAPQRNGKFSNLGAGV